MRRLAGGFFLPGGSAVTVNRRLARYSLRAIIPDSISRRKECEKRYRGWLRFDRPGRIDARDIAGRVRAIDVQRGEPASGNRRASIGSPGEVEALVGMIVRAPVRRPSVHPAGEPYYWLTIWLTDGTTLGRPYFADTSELMGGVVLPVEVRATLDRYPAN